MRRVARRYSVRSTGESTPGSTGLRVVSAESRPMRLSGIPCHSCTITAPVVA